MTSKKLLAILLLVLAMVATACGGDGGDDEADTGDDTATTEDGGDGDGGDGGGEALAADFTLFGAKTGDEATAVQGVLDAWNAENGSTIEYTGSDDFETQLQIRVDGGDPPAVAFTPQPGTICELADAGELVSLEDMDFDIAEMEENHSEFWMNLGLCEDGNHYGIPWHPNFKSIIFYHQPTFEEMGYEVPESYDDMVALSQQIVDDGMTPWCFGFESGGATGWPGTDWIEDIFIRQHGPELYTQWYQHEIPFDSPEVVETFETFSEIFFGEGFVLGGPENVPGIDFRDSPGPLFSDPPGCLMLKQGSFINNFFEQSPDFEEGEDAEIGVFNFPTIDGNTGAMGGGDTFIVFDDAPANVQFVKDMITPTWLCTLASPGGGGIAEFGGHGQEGIELLPGHKDVDLDCYETEQSRTFAEAITTALDEQTFVFDASDLMPPAVGQGSLWEGLIDYALGTPVEDIVADVESSWPS